MTNLAFYCEWEDELAVNCEDTVRGCPPNLVRPRFLLAPKPHEEKAEHPRNGFYILTRIPEVEDF